MPHKIGYSIVGSTGEAEGYSAKNLEYHSPTVSGWQTPRFCVYPQELIIRLGESARLRKLQLLAHQYMIPTKIEFYVGGSDSSRSFKRLGYIHLSSNEKTGFKSRELKSVHVDADGLFVKLVLHKNHLNKFNLYNQVSIMAFNVLGDTHSRNDIFRDESLLYSDPAHKDPDYISPMDDLAFDIYQDPEVAKIIRRLDARKSECVREENFDTAKKMKQAIADLRKVGEKLARYELEKRKAIETEDYDLAKSKKSQMEEYRLKVYQQLRKYGLIEEAGIPNYFEMQQSPRPQPSEPPVYATRAPPALLESPRPAQGYDEETRMSNPTSPEFLNDVSQHLEEVPEERELAYVQSLSPVKTRLSYDDKVIPALNKKRQQEQPPPVEEEQNPASPDLDRALPSGEPEPMSEKSIREASSTIDVFGLPIVSSAYSKTFSFREDALSSIYKKLNELPSDTGKEELRTYLRATVFILKRLSMDKVHSVFTSSLQLLEMVLTQYIPQHKLGKAEVSYVVNQLLPKLIQKTGESASRARNSALDFIDKMSTFTNVRQSHIIPQTALQPFKPNMAMRLALSRVEIVHRMVKTLGLEAPTITAENVMHFCLPSLEHTSGAVREATCQVIYQLYRIAGDTVKDLLPPDEPATRKNMLYRNIFDELDRIDGKPTQAELRAKRDIEARENERKKQEEIEQLQSQIQQLRNVNAKVGNAPSAAQSKKPAQTTKPKGGVDAGKPAAEQPEFADDLSANLENMCIFCGEHDDSFNDEGLDLHYWKHCPMLKRCEHCKQVVEISGFNEHLVSECDKKKMFGKCDRCSEAIPTTELQKHVSEKKCTINKPERNHRCPMCHRNIPLGEESWKSHLMGAGKDACAENARRIPSLNRLKAKNQIRAIGNGPKNPPRAGKPAGQKN